MRLLTLAIALTLASGAFADTVRMKDGRRVHGTYLGGSARQVRIEVGDQIQTLDVTDIERIEFGGPAAMPAPPPPPPPPPPAEAEDRPRQYNDRPRQAEDRPRLMRPDPNPPPPPPAPDSQMAQGSIELPSGTNIVVRMIDGVDSETARAGQTFQASLDQPIMLPNGQMAVDRGADVVVKLVDAKESGTFTGRAELALNLQSVRVNGRMVDVNTQSVSRVSNSQGGETAKRGAAGAIIGAGLGAVLGGGKGAATGAAVGGAAGAGTQVITKGQRVRIPSETRLTFVLDTAVRI
jgi:hypothetical protein